MPAGVRKQHSGTTLRWHMSYLVLTFDGGGIRGVLTARLLERLVADQPDLLEKTQLLAGTSTGGIIALGLAFGLSPARLVTLYRENGSAIFDASWLHQLADLGGI